MTGFFSDSITPLKSDSQRIAIGIEKYETAQIGHMLFTYPEKHNVIDLEGWQAIPKALATLLDAGDTRLIVLRGADGDAFVAGADISQFEEAFSGASGVHYDAATINAFEAIGACPVPTLAAIEGFCIGGGLGIALHCDLRLAREDSTFGVPAARLGLAYPPNATLRLVEIVGRAAANEILFTAHRFDAQTALKIGLLNRLTGMADFETSLTEWVAQIAANAPLSLQAAKFIMDNPQAAASKINKHLAACLQSEDYEEGRTAFMKKRKPKFFGK